MLIFSWYMLILESLVIYYLLPLLFGSNIFPSILYWNLILVFSPVVRKEDGAALDVGHLVVWAT